ncbi:MAG: DMT family transporter [Sporichthyaceae bacterium]|nr:DMT family transporter [Sporichthyaceae bacterium]
MTAARPGVVSRPPRQDLLLMTVGVVAVSTSGPLIAALVAPALAVAVWRNVLALAVIAPWAVATRLSELRALTQRERRWAVGSGVLLALHFATWIPSLRLTSVASATAIVCTQPVWVALIARATGHSVPRRAWLGIGIALAAVAVLTGVDFSFEPRALIGDLLALLGGLFAAFYTVAGAEVRRTVSTTSYTAICYATAALVLLAVCLVVGVDLWGYDARTWWQLAALTAGAQLLGHSVFNRVLRTTSPTVVSLVLLLEVPGAAVIAATWLGQVPPLAALPAALLLLLGLAIVVSARPPDVEPAIPAE